MDKGSRRKFAEKGRRLEESHIGEIVERLKKLERYVLEADPAECWKLTLMVVSISSGVVDNYLEFL